SRPRPRARRTARRRGGGARRPARRAAAATASPSNRGYRRASGAALPRCRIPAELWHCGGAVPRPLFTTTHAARLSPRRWLHADAPRAAVVLVHGFSASADHPDVCDLAEVLHTDGVDVVCYDARGHGTSEGHSTLGDLERHDVAAAVDAARDRSDRVVLVGASMGAIAALR